MPLTGAIATEYVFVDNIVCRCAHVTTSVCFNHGNENVTIVISL